MKKEDYTTNITVNATVKEAFEAINTITNWWTENLEGSSDKLNDVFTVNFGTTRKTFKIVELIPDAKVVWLVTESYMPWNVNKNEWNGTKISFEISEKDNKTQILFTHQGLVPAFVCYGACSDAWSDYLEGSLLSLINTGKGQAEPKEG